MRSQGVQGQRCVPVMAGPLEAVRVLRLVLSGMLL